MWSDTNLAYCNQTGKLVRTVSNLHFNDQGINPHGFDCSQAQFVLTCRYCVNRITVCGSVHGFRVCPWEDSRPFESITRNVDSWAGRGEALHLSWHKKNLYITWQLHSSTAPTYARRYSMYRRADEAPIVADGTSSGQTCPDSRTAATTLQYSSGCCWDDSFILQLPCCGCWRPSLMAAAVAALRTETAAMIVSSADVSRSADHSELSAESLSWTD